MKLMMVVAASACAVSLSASAAEPVEKPVETDEEETQLFSVGADLDFFSAYVWRNAVQNDDMVMQPCVWADFTGLEPFTFGFYIWQNYDLTGNRQFKYDFDDGRATGLRRSLSETDYNIYAGYTVWTSEDEDFSLDLEFGHDWYTYQYVRREDKAWNPDTRELYLKTTFANPVADVYAQASWMYQDFGEYHAAMHYELGFKKEVDIVEDTLTAGADWNVNFGDANYLYYLYDGSSSGKYVDDDGVIADDYASKTYGFGGTTIKFYATWQITEWLSLKGTVAYTGILNQNLRDTFGEQGEGYGFCGGSYPRDLVWGGLSLNVEF